MTDILKVHLMAYSGIRRDNPEIIEALLSPFQQGVSFPVSLVFFGDILFQRILCAVVIHLNGVINNQIYRNQRIDLHWISAKILNRIPHGSQINHRRNTGKILHQHPGRMKRDFHRLVIPLFPPRDMYKIFFGHRPTVQFS